MSDLFSNDLIKDENGIWRLRNLHSFAYSDGRASEAYLRHAMTLASDLSTTSDELQGFIKDWPSEYHLTRKRAQLLEGLDFPRSLRVLEVGCGCGAITRHLGESFDEVVSVEGSIERAKLARLRTRDLDSVTIVCAPFQDIRFTQKFDVIFCIGVFEYSGAFILGDDPYRAALAYFSDMLTPGGILVIAIENQFGLKYFNGAREDHLNTFFEGVEGYHDHPGRARTFGRVELEKLLSEHFAHSRFLYPYPDYKIPDCVLSAEFLASGRAGEVVAGLPSRDYAGPMRRLWREALANLELSRNEALEFFSNSFLVLASRAPLDPALFDQLGVLYSNGRTLPWSTKTRIVSRPDGSVVAEKRRRKTAAEPGNAQLRHVEADSVWVNGLSLHTILARRACTKSLDIAQIFAPSWVWLDHLRQRTTVEDGVAMIDGAALDCIWTNSYVVDDTCTLIDQEWVWNEKLRLNALIVRALYNFLIMVEDDYPAGLQSLPRSGTAAIKTIASTLGVELQPADFREFLKIESALGSAATHHGEEHFQKGVRWFLRDRPSRRIAKSIKKRADLFVGRVAAKIQSKLGS